MLLTKELFLKTMDMLFFPLHINSFPGSQPVALSKEKLPSLLFGYQATLKTDGEREFLWLDGTNVFAINRNLRIWHVTSELDPISTHWMLMDVEYVAKDGFFYAFDLLVYDGKNICDLEICQRMWLLSEFLSMNSIPFLKVKAYYSVFDILHIYQQNEIHNLENNSHTSITPSIYTPITNASIHTLHPPPLTPMPTDGILFVRQLASYQPFRIEMDNILKWKPIVTLDFLAKINENKVELMCLHNNGFYLYAVEEWHTDNSLDINKIHNVIVECKLENDHWVWIRNRTDKSKPNTLEVVESTLKTMDVTFEDLERVLNKDLFTQ